MTVTVTVTVTVMVMVIVMVMVMVRLWMALLPSVRPRSKDGCFVCGTSRMVIDQCQWLLRNGLARSTAPSPYV